MQTTVVGRERKRKASCASSAHLSGPVVGWGRAVPLILPSGRMGRGRGRVTGVTLLMIGVGAGGERAVVLLPRKHIFDRRAGRESYHSLFLSPPPPSKKKSIRDAATLLLWGTAVAFSFSPLTPAKWPVATSLFARTVGQVTNGEMAVSVVAFVGDGERGKDSFFDSTSPLID